MIKFFASNLVDQAILSATSENMLFPLSNLKHPFRSKVYRSQASTTSVIFDFQETSEIDSVVMVPDKGQGLGFTTATLHLNATADFTSPAFSQPISINTINDIAKAEFTLQSYRFARIVFTSTLSYVEASKIFIGKKIEFANGAGVDFGWSYQDDDTSVIKENAYGQKFIDERPRQKRESFSLRALDKDELDQVFEIYDQKGKSKPFFLLIGTDEMINDPDRLGGMFYMSSVPSIINRTFGLYDLSMSIEEAM